MTATHVRRCLLFMPGDSRRKIEKGVTLAPDCIIMDLEDGVAMSQKAAARQITAGALQALDFGRSERLVRVNPVGTPLVAADLAAVVPARPAGIVLPKTQSVDDIGWLDAQLAGYERQHGWPVGEIGVIALVESAAGVVNLREIASASPRLVALAFGAEDLSGDIGAIRSPGYSEVQYARQAVVIHAAAAGLQAIDTPHVDLNSPITLAAQSKLAREWGYDGKFAIHPAQIKLIQTAFSPSAAEIAYAQKLVAAWEQHQSSGSGVFTLDDRMIDTPMLRAAQRVLALAAAINPP